jgi:hypothetical protein
MKYLQEGSAALVTLLASGALLAQSTPVKPAPNTKNTTVAQAQTPPSGGASTGAEAAGGTATGMSTGTMVAIGVGVAAVAAAAASSGGGSSTTTHH